LADLVFFSDALEIFAFDEGHLLDQNARLILDQPSELSELMSAVGALMDQPYWRRGWTLQEACAHGVSIFFPFGNHSCKLLGWGLFFQAREMIREVARERNVYDKTCRSLDCHTILPFV
jgi:hypothetical protein